MLPEPVIYVLILLSIASVSSVVAALVFLPKGFSRAMFIFVPLAVLVSAGGSALLMSSLDLFTSYAPAQ